MAKRVYLVRHGETLSNEQGVIQGSNDELSQAGQTQALALAKRLQAISFQHLIVSDYTRTRQTVAALQPYIAVTPEYSSLVRETKQPSSLVGKSNSSSEFLSYYDKVTENLGNPEWRYEDEETFYDVVKRVSQFIEVVQSREGDVVVVTHGRFIIYTVMYILTEGKLTYDVWRLCRHGFTTTNTGISILEYSERYQGLKLKTFNDIAHFSE